MKKCDNCGEEELLEEGCKVCGQKLMEDTMNKIDKILMREYKVQSIEELNKIIDKKTDEYLRKR